MNHKFKRLKRHFDALIKYRTPGKILNLLRVEYEYRRGAHFLRGMPYIYVIDPTNFCNLKCEFCPTWKGELPIPKGKINTDDYKTIISKIKPYAFKVILYNWGEPFLHPHITELISITHKNRIASTISSNMNYLPDGLENDIINAGLDHLVISANGLSSESYLKYHKGGNFETVVENINRITAAKKKLKSKTPHLEFQFLVFKHNEHEVSGVESFSKNLGCDSFRISAPYIDISRKDEFLSTDEKYILEQYKKKNNSQAKSLKNRRRCFWVWRAMVINWNGDVDPCCGKNKHGAFANLLTDELGAAWNNMYYQSARRRLTGSSLQDDIKTACNFCSGYDY